MIWDVGFGVGFGIGCNGLMLYRSHAASNVQRRRSLHSWANQPTTGTTNNVLNAIEVTLPI